MSNKTKYAVKRFREEASANGELSVSGASVIKLGNLSGALRPDLVPETTTHLNPSENPVEAQWTQPNQNERVTVYLIQLNVIESEPPQAPDLCFICVILVRHALFRSLFPVLHYFEQASCHLHKILQNVPAQILL
jgi:hypothetical protein